MPVISTIAAATARAFGAFKAAAGGAADEFFNYVTLLLHGDGTNGAQNNTFLDSSTNNFTITRNGNTTQGTFSPFSQDDGKWSAYFDGSGDYLQLADSTAWDLTGDYTIEMWFYKSSSASQTFFQLGTSSNILLYQNASNAIIFYSGSAVITSSATAPLNQWNHVALVRNGGGSNNTVMYLNGVNVGQATNTTSFTGDASNGVRIGAEYPTGFEFTGYISNVRIVKGTAVYTSAFTPSTTPLTAITNTSLLTCQSNRFKDNSANAFAITVNGNTSIQPFSPFAPSAAYSAATNGGSGYFDGSGDYLSITNNAAFNLGTNNFCIDGWFYPNNSNATQLVFNKWGTVSDAQSMFQIGRISSTFYAQLKTTGGFVTLSTATWIPNAWNHFAVVRDGSTISAYLNGVRFGTDTSNPTLNTGTETMTIGSKQAQDYFAGYIYGCRIVNGTAVYDPTQTTITVPTSPVTAITNTSLLLNFTNAGILDNTGRNDLETVGNAQISTSVKKFGTGSLAFDGTGDRLFKAAASDPLTDLGLSNEPFTVEQWVYFNSVSGDFCVSANKGGGTAGWNGTDGHQYLMGLISSGTYYLQVWNGSSLSSNSVSNPFSTGQWYHYAVCYDGTTTKVFVNGSSILSVTISYGKVTNANRFTVGDSPSYTGPLNGYIDDLRITKGVARYTSNFTPPTAAFEDQ